MVKKDPVPKRKSLLESPEMVEAKKLMEKYAKAKNDLSQLIDQFREKTGVSANDVKAIFDNQKNFTPQQWELFQAEKDKLFGSLSSFEEVLDPKRKKMVEEIKNPPAKKKSGSKTRGIRQKWILVK